MEEEGGKAGKGSRNRLLGLKMLCFSGFGPITAVLASN